MRPSVVLDMKRSAVREAVGGFRAANPGVFGSVLHGTTGMAATSTLLVDALPGAALDLGDLEELKSLLGVDIDLLSPGDLPRNFRAKVLSGGAAGMSENRLPDSSTTSSRPQPMHAASWKGWQGRLLGRQVHPAGRHHEPYRHRRGCDEGDGWLRRVTQGACRRAVAQHAQYAQSHGPRLSTSTSM